MQRVTKGTAADGTYSIAEYDPTGNVVFATDALGRVTQNFYDARGRLYATIGADDTVVTVRDDGGGRVVATTDALGNTTTVAYDVLGRTLTQAQPDPTGGSTPSTTKYHYDDASDKQYVTDALGSSYTDTNHTAETDLDKMGHTIKVIGPVPASGQSRPTTYSHYDANGNLDGVSDARGAAPSDPTNLATYDFAHLTQYTYDEANRESVLYQTDPDGASPWNWVLTSYAYDNDGNLVDLGAPGINGYTYLHTIYQYDTLGRKIRETQPNPATGSTSQSDPNCPNTYWSYDSNGNLASVTDPNGNVTRYLYDIRAARPWRPTLRGPMWATRPTARRPLTMPRATCFS